MINSLTFVLSIHENKLPIKETLEGMTQSLPQWIIFSFGCTWSTLRSLSIQRIEVYYNIIQRKTTRIERVLTTFITLNPFLICMYLINSQTFILCIQRNKLYHNAKKDLKNWNNLHHIHHNESFSHLGVHDRQLEVCLFKEYYRKRHNWLKES